MTRLNSMGCYINRLNISPHLNLIATRHMSGRQDKKRHLFIGLTLNPQAIFFTPPLEKHPQIQ